MQHAEPDQPDTRGRSRRSRNSANSDSPVSPASPLASFSGEEWRLIVALRESYDKGLDLLNPSELARMRFLKWLVDTGRLEP